MHCVTGIDSASVQKIGAHTAARAFGSHQDHINIIRRNDAGLLLIDNGKPVRKIKRISLVETFLQLGPYCSLSCIGKKILDNCASFGGFFEGKKRLARNKPVRNGAVPIFIAFELPDDDRKAVIFEIQRLSRPLNAVTEHCDFFVFEDFPGFVQRKFFRCNHVFHNTAKIYFSHFKFSCYYFFVDICQFTLPVRSSAFRRYLRFRHPTKYRELQNPY